MGRRITVLRASDRPSYPSPYPANVHPRNKCLFPIFNSCLLNVPTARIYSTNLRTVHTQTSSACADRSSSSLEVEIVRTDRYHFRIQLRILVRIRNPQYLRDALP